MNSRERNCQQYCELGPGGRAVMESRLSIGSWTLALVLLPFTLGLSLGMPLLARKTVREWREAALKAGGGALQ